MMIDDTRALPVVRFSAGGYHFAIETRQVAAMLSEGGTAGQPIEELLGLAQRQQGSQRWLAIHGRVQRIGVSEPVQLDTIDAACVRNLPPLVTCRPCLPALAALAIEGERLSLLLDPRALPKNETIQNNTDLEMPS